MPLGSFVLWERDRLMRNDRGIFTEAPPEVGLNDSLLTFNAIWLDYDRDGDLDLYVGRISPFKEAPNLRNSFYQNHGNGTFTDVLGEVGLDVDLHSTGSFQEGGSGGGMAAGDFNNDGWPDLYLGVGRAPNRLFLNDRQGRFQDATTRDIGDQGQAFGVAVGDIDNDGNLDIFQAAGAAGGVFGEFRSFMLWNLGDGQFLDVTEGIGMFGLWGHNVEGAGLADIDNDGDLDLLTALSHFLYLNNGDGTSFVDATTQSGIADVKGAASFGDYDGDDFLDVAFGMDPDASQFGGLYRNNGNDNHYLRVELVGIKSNRNGIGARLIATAGDLQQMREILGGLGIYQDEMVAHFGLGSRTQVDQLQINWPSGQKDVLNDILADQKIRVFEGRENYHRVQPNSWEIAPPGSLQVGSAFDLRIAVRPALFEAEAEIVRVTADLNAFGGPTSLSLAAGKEGAYMLEKTVVPGGGNGFRTLSVLIEQNTSLGPHWSILSKTITVLSGEDQQIFADELLEDWRLETGSSVDFDPRTTGEVYQGRFAIAFETNTSDVRSFTAHPVVPVGYTSLRFAFHPGDAVLKEQSGENLMDLIAFESDRDSNDGTKEIHVMGSNGSNPVNLTNHPADDRLSSWSPNGTRIAFESDRDGNDEIYVMGSDGTDPINLTNHPAVEVYPAWIAAGVSASRAAGFEVAVNDNTIELLGGKSEYDRVDMDQKEWQVVEIPLKAFDLQRPIESIRFLGNMEGTFYLKDIRLVAVTPPQPNTAVLEEHTATLPQAFTLSQNYPNPFNSSTVIRFALPASEEVELAVYNLMGQKVATLVEGVREAGTYTLHWDGRDGHGRALASGVYFYRLQADGQVETRRLLLLK